MKSYHINTLSKGNTKSTITKRAPAPIPIAGRNSPTLKTASAMNSRSIRIYTPTGGSTTAWSQGVICARQHDAITTPDM
ncbi:hypothetical protein AJ80_01600 [Polytolypa hystricis UAMH7299]|uniref:Uncharacterized protein n=1 Tax=Polytolypa hystricis (strain UAMH7299) TaxID=1447883 RepID=A0A2B7YRL0_POLH7|nr:hypothetical protein AJ80_01600 [Polytolypa hystricis UAMH7299]